MEVISPAARCYDPLVSPSTVRWASALRTQLNHAIEEKRLSQQKIADESGVSQSAVSQFLSGKTKIPSADILIAGCKLLGVSVDALVGLRTHETAPVPIAPATIDAYRRQLERFAAAILAVSAHAGGQATSPRADASDTGPGTRKGR